jgi:hypothetical protein
MGFLLDVNGFLDTNSWLFYTLLFTTAFGAVPFFVIALVHAIRGNRQKLPIQLSLMVLLNYIVYLIYIITFAVGDGYNFMGAFFYYLTLVIFSLVHWVIAHTYFECACVNPF